MEVTVLASGSKGNSTYINTGKTKILIDVGITYQNLVSKLKKIGVEIKDLDAILITHEHQDHIKGLKMLLKNEKIKQIYLSQGTKKFVDKENISNNFSNYNCIKADQTFNINDIKIKTVMLSHDANEPIGFIIYANNKKTVLITDTGYVDQSYFSDLKNADLYILEANHDPELLMSSRRPYHLKMRIISEKGHLSNDEASWLINHVVEDEYQTIWVVAHISEDCNTPYLFEKSLVKHINNPLKVNILYSSQETLETIKL